MNAATIVSRIISDAVKAGSSDIHFEPTEENIRIRFRIDGILYDIETISRQLMPQIISRIKIIANLDIAEHRVPQDGSATAHASDLIDMRISTMPTVNGEKVVIRLLDMGKSMVGLENLGICETDLNSFKKLLSKPYGMILVTGPTGSGKTTTLYSSIAYLNCTSKNIITIEDPVEYKMKNIVQTQVNYKTGLTFVRGLRAILRQDPDIIMVGEIRDSETARIATAAAMTGHLVLSTLHTNNSCGAICRLIDMGIEPYFISSVLLGVIAQRLVRKSCASCNAVGCNRCRGNGYKGRIGIFELLFINDCIRDLIAKKAALSELMLAAKKFGWRPIIIDGKEKARMGVTTFEEVFRIAALESLQE